MPDREICDLAWRRLRLAMGGANGRTVVEGLATSPQVLPHVVSLFQNISVNGLSAAIAGAMGSAAGALPCALGYAVLFGGSSLMQWREQRKSEKWLRNHFGELALQLEQLTAGQESSTDVLQALARREFFVWAKLDGEDKQALAARLRNEVATLLHDAEVHDREKMDDLVTLAFDSNGQLRQLALDVAEIGRTQAGTVLPALARIESLVRDVRDTTRAGLGEDLRADLKREILASLRQEREVLELLEEPDSIAQRLAEAAIGALREKEFSARVRDVGAAEAVLENLERKATAQQTAAGHLLEVAAEHWRTFGEWSLFIGDLASAEKGLRRAITLREGDALAFLLLGHVQSTQEHFDEAKSSYVQAGERAGDSPVMSVRVRMALALLLASQKRLDEAETKLRECADECRRLGYREGLAKAVGNLGVTYLLARRPSDAEVCFHESLGINRGLGREEGVARQLGNLGLASELRGDLATAVRHYRTAYELDVRLRRLEGVATHALNLGLAAWASGDRDSAKAYLVESRDANRKLGRLSAADSCAEVLREIA